LTLLSTVRIQTRKK